MSAQVYKKCEFCGKEYKSWKNKNRKFCSKLCSEKSSIGRKGIKHPQQMKEYLSKIRGNDNYFNCKCVTCGKIFHLKPSILKRKDSNRGRFCSKGCYAKTRSKWFKGKNNRFWRGGITPQNLLRLNSDGWNKTRKQVYKRDNYTCQICGKSNYTLHAHHIVPYRVTLDNSMENLITLCNHCHSKEEGKYHHKLKGQIEFNFAPNTEGGDTKCHEL